MKNLVSMLPAAVLAFAPMPAFAASKAEINMLKGAAECAYVVKIAEDNGTRLNYGSATWNDLLSQASQKLGEDTAPYLASARAKYQSRAQKMGDADTLRRIIDNAKKCDSGL